MAQKFKALVGLSYQDASGDWKFVKPGSVVDDIPAASIAGLKKDGAIELADTKEGKE